MEQNIQLGDPSMYDEPKKSAKQWVSFFGKMALAAIIIYLVIELAKKILDKRAA